MKKPIVSKTDYSIRRRFFDNNGDPLPWQDHGRGTFLDKKTIQSQINLLNNRKRKTEIEIILNKDRVDQDLYPSNENLIYEK